ncbi:MAG: hypothetical protein AAFV25_24615, partial [Bacteroidota bacterium]
RLIEKKVRFFSQVFTAPFCIENRVTETSVLSSICLSKNENLFGFCSMERCGSLVEKLFLDELEKLILPTVQACH